MRQFARYAATGARSRSDLPLAHPARTPQLTVAHIVHILNLEGNTPQEPPLRNPRHPEPARSIQAHARLSALEPLPTLPLLLLLLGSTNASTPSDAPRVRRDVLAQAAVKVGHAEARDDERHEQHEERDHAEDRERLLGDPVVAEG